MKHCCQIVLFLLSCMIVHTTNAQDTLESQKDDITYATLLLPSPNAWRVGLNYTATFSHAGPELVVGYRHYKWQLYGGFGLPNLSRFSDWKVGLQDQNWMIDVAYFPESYTGGFEFPVHFIAHYYFANQTNNAGASVPNRAFEGYITYGFQGSPLRKLQLFHNFGVGAVYSVSNTTNNTTGQQNSWHLGAMMTIGIRYRIF